MLQSLWVGYHPALPLCRISSQQQSGTNYHFPRDAPPKETFCTRRIYTTTPQGEGMERGMWCVPTCVPASPLARSVPLFLSSCTNRLGRYQGERFRGSRALSATASRSLFHPHPPRLPAPVPHSLPAESILVPSSKPCLQTHARTHTHKNTDPDTREKQRAADLSLSRARARLCAPPPSLPRNMYIV